MCIAFALQMPLEPILRVENFLDPLILIVVASGGDGVTLLVNEKPIRTLLIDRTGVPRLLAASTVLGG